MNTSTLYSSALKAAKKPLTQQEADAKAKAAVQTGQTVPRTLEELKAAQGVKEYASGGSAGSYPRTPQQSSTPGFTSAQTAQQTAGQAKNVSGELGKTIAMAQISAMAKDAASGGIKPSGGTAQNPTQTAQQTSPQQSTDYSLLIRDAIAAGADAATVQGLLDRRVEKALGDPALNKYAFDDTYSAAKSYIDANSRPVRDDRAEDMAAELTDIYRGDDGLYAQALAAQQAANDAAVKQAVGRLRAQKDETDSSYADLFRQLYLNKMRDAKNIDQLLADRGITGGAAESTALSMNAGYEEALRQGARDRINAQSELDRAITETELTGDVSNAEAAANNAAARASGYADVLRGLISRYDTLYENEAARDSDRSARARNYAYQTALAMMQSGVMPSDELLISAGITKGDALSAVSRVQDESERARLDTDAATARNIVMTMLQSGVMPSDALLGAAGISRADAESIAGAVREETAYSRSSETASAALKTAMTMLQSGVMPSDELLREAGIRTQDALSLASAGQAAARQSTGTGTAGTSYTKARAEAALAAALAGDTGPAVRQIVEGYYGLPLETVLSIYTGEAAGEEESGTDYGGAEITAPAAYTPTPPEESLDYDADSGIFRWNGGIYTDLKSLTDDMSDARLSEATEKSLERKFASLGWPQVRIK
jgi:hypothetical protein